MTNSGNVTLSGPFTGSDDKAADDSCPATASLAPGASITCTASYTITQADLDAGAVTNVASASNGTVTSPTDTETVTAVQNASIDIQKTPDTPTVASGDTATFTIVMTTARIDGFVQDHEGAPAYVFRIRGEDGGVIAVAALLVRDGEDRPYSFVQSLVQPALECLQRELQACASVDSLTFELRSRDDDLELLLKMAPDDPGSPEAGDELGVMVQNCVDHLGCHLGAIVVPERNIAICRAPRGERPEVELLTKIHRHLLNWAQLQRRNLVINKLKVRPIELPPYKILATPVLQGSGRFAGFLVMFRDEKAPNFGPRTERLAELLARKTTTVLANNFDSQTALLTRTAFEAQVRAQLAGRRAPVPECVRYLVADPARWVTAEEVLWCATRGGARA